MTAPVDVQGKAYVPGQRVARGVSLNKGGSTSVEIVRITRVEQGRVYMNDSKQPIKFPGRMAILG